MNAQGVFSYAVVVIDVRSHSLVGAPIPVGNQPLSFAMDPFVNDSDGNAFVLLASGEIDQLSIGGGTPSLAGVVVSSLPPGPNQGPVQPTAMAITPGGQTLLVSWGQRDFFGLFSVSTIGKKVNQQWSFNTGTFDSITDIAVAPDGSKVYAAETDGFSASTVFELPIPLPPSGQFAGWCRGTIVATCHSPGPSVSDARSLTVSPDGHTVYLVGTTGTNGTSILDSLSASTGSLGPQVSLAMATNSDGSGGAEGVAASPDGHRVVVAGVDNPTQQTRVYTVTTSPFAASAPRVLSDEGSTTGPQNVAITPDQAPTASFTASTGVRAGNPESFDANGSNVIYGRIASFHWDFGDPTSPDNVKVTFWPTATVSHTYAVAADYHVTLIETDSAGTSIPPAPGAGVFSVDGPGQTPFRFAAKSARTQQQITILTPTGNPPPPTTVPNHPTTTVKHAKPKPSSGTPKLKVDPIVGSPGSIVTVTGTGFKPNTSVKVSWSTSTGSFVEKTDGHGNLPAHMMFILTPDVLGPRFAVASSTPVAKAAFLVVSNTAEPGGDNAALLFRSEGQ